MSRSLSYALATALVISGAVPVFAATTPTAETAAQMTADQDFGKVSKDGQSALRDIHRVRLDIFNGQIDHAKTSIAKAISSLDKAQSDETVFTKAESDLKPPASMQGKTQAAADTGNTTASNTTATASKTPVQWLPVDGAMTIGEDYVATPEKAAGVKQANEKLVKGDKKGALDALKLANVDVDFLLEVAPLKATTSGVKQASDELGAGKYYEANQSLKSVEDAMRYDSQVLVATPQKTDAAHPAKSNG